MDIALHGWHHCCYSHRPWAHGVPPQRGEHLATSSYPWMDCLLAGCRGAPAESGELGLCHYRCCLSFLQAPLGSPSYSPIHPGLTSLLRRAGTCWADWQPPLISPLRSLSVGYLWAWLRRPLGSGVSGK